MQKFYLSISQFAQLTGISRKTLIHYDRIGLVKPALIQDNGYRWYTAQQVNVVSIIQALRLLNIPLEEIHQHLDGRTPASSLTLFEEQSLRIRDQIKKLERVHAMLESRIRATKTAIAPQSQGVMLLQQEAVPIVKSKAMGGYGQYLIQDNWNDLFQQLTAYGVAWGAPLGMIVPLDDFLANSLNISTCRYYTECPDDTKTPDTKPAGLYAVIRDYANSRKTQLLYDNLFAFIAKHRMCPCSDIYETYLLDELCCRSAEQYFVQIAVCVRPK